MAQNDTHKHIPPEKTALAFDRDKNLVYRPQDEGLDNEYDEYEAQSEGEKSLETEKSDSADIEIEDEKPNSPRTKAWMQTNEAAVSGNFDDLDEDKRDLYSRPRETVNTVRKEHH